MTPEEAKKLEAAARRAVDAIENGAQAAGLAAAVAAKDAYFDAHDIDGARQRLREAIRKRIASEDALPDHPWEGARVFRIEAVGWGGRQKKRVEGIVETVRSTTEFAGNIGDWRKPEIGKAIVRSLKKDGTPGVKFKNLNSHWGGLEWQLCEPASAIETREGQDPQGLGAEHESAIQQGDAL